MLGHAGPCSAMLCHALLCWLVAQARGSCCCNVQQATGFAVSEQHKLCRLHAGLKKQERELLREISGVCRQQIIIERFVCTAKDDTIGCCYV